MSLIVNERYTELKRRLSPRAWVWIKETARREQISLSAVIHQYPNYLPKRLRKLAEACFVETHSEWIEARLTELRRIVRKLEAEKARESE